MDIVQTLTENEQHQTSMTITTIPICVWFHPSEGSTTAAAVINVLRLNYCERHTRPSLFRFHVRP